MEITNEFQYKIAKEELEDGVRLVLWAQDVKVLGFYDKFIIIIKSCLGLLNYINVNTHTCTHTHTPPLYHEVVVGHSSHH